MGEPRPVQCKECGNLCVHNVNTGEDVPMSRVRRETGEPTDFEIEYCEAIPVCAVRMVEFTGNDEEVVATRNCNEFVQYEPGLKLKDYTEMRLLDAVKRENEKSRRLTYLGSIIASIIVAIVTTVVSTLITKWIDGDM